MKSFTHTFSKIVLVFGTDKTQNEHYVFWMLYQKEVEEMLNSLLKNSTCLLKIRKIETACSPQPSPVSIASEAGQPQARSLPACQPASLPGWDGQARRNELCPLAKGKGTKQERICFYKLTSPGQGWDKKNACSSKLSYLL